MAMMKISASFPHGMDDPVYGPWWQEFKQAITAS